MWDVQTSLLKREDTKEQNYCPLRVQRTVHGVAHATLSFWLPIFLLSMSPFIANRKG